MLRKFKNLKGLKFGRLTVEKFSHVGHERAAYWQCVCSCGNKVVVIGSSLSRGATQSCGCLQKERVATASRTHGHCVNHKKSPTMNSWKSMLERCGNSKHKQFADYGGRGIIVDPRWTVFEWFLEDMGVRPEGKTLDRIDPDGDYCKANCRWATYKEQAANKR